MSSKANAQSKPVVAQSFDPTTGIVYMNMYQPGAATGEQVSGVLIAPDEVLTVAHGVYGGAGGNTGIFQNAGTVIPALNAGSSPFGSYSINGVNVMPEADYNTAASGQTDFAVIHLSAPVVGAAIFSLGSGFTTGTLTVSGYPAASGGAYVSQTETVSQMPGMSMLTGQALTSQPAGSSGGPDWTMTDGLPTVYGINESANSADMNVGYFTQLTSADVTQIQAWVAADDPGTPWGLAAGLLNDAAQFGSNVQTTMQQVAAALQQATRDGYTGATLNGALLDAESTLWNVVPTAGAAKIDTAYLAGLIAGETGQSQSGLTKSIATQFPGVMGASNGTRQAALAGYLEGQSIAAAANGLTPTVSKSSKVASKPTQSGSSSLTSALVKETAPFDANAFASSLGLPSSNTYGSDYADHGTHRMGSQQALLAASIMGDAGSLDARGDTLTQAPAQWQTLVVNHGHNPFGA
jgi:V8-like Glu-specific endopeptidase